jgi:hypothetical protein
MSKKCILYISSDLTTMTNRMTCLFWPRNGSLIKVLNVTNGSSSRQWVKVVVKKKKKK